MWRRCAFSILVTRTCACVRARKGGTAMAGGAGARVVTRQVAGMVGRRSAVVFFAVGVGWSCLRVGVWEGVPGCVCWPSWWEHHRQRGVAACGPIVGACARAEKSLVTCN